MKSVNIKVYSKNNEFQHIEVIKNNRKKRSKNKEFFVEGAKSITNAVENNWDIKFNLQKMWETYFNLLTILLIVVS